MLLEMFLLWTRYLKQSNRSLRNDVNLPWYKGFWHLLLDLRVESFLTCLMPRSHQSLNMFKSCLVKHGLKLFSL